MKNLEMKDYVHNPDVDGGVGTENGQSASVDKNSSDTLHLKTPEDVPGSVCGCVDETTYNIDANTEMFYYIVISSMTIVISSLYIIYWTWSVYTHNYDVI